MTPDIYRDMHLLNEVTQTPDATQRDLAKRIGVALGLTNLMLRRLAKKGYIKVVNVQKSRLQYLITPQGVMEKARLAREYVEYSLFFYRNVRTFLQDRLRQLADEGHRRFLVWGTGELAEIAFLTLQESGLVFVGAVDPASNRERFLGHPVQRIEDIPPSAYDRIIMASLQWGDSEVEQRAMQRVPLEKLLIMPRPGLEEAPELAQAVNGQGAV